GDPRRVARGGDVPAEVGRTAALPDDGGGDGRTGPAVPDDGGLALVGDADGSEPVGGYAGARQDAPRRSLLGPPDLFGILLHPAVTGIPALDRSGAHGQDIGVAVK